MTLRFPGLPLVLACAACAAQQPAAAMDDARATNARAAARWTPDAWSTGQYETTPTFSGDGALAVFMRADRAFRRYRLMESRCVDGRWTRPREPAFSADTAMHDGDPFLAPDGKSLYFISTRHRFAEAGNDDFDIYVVARDGDGNWGTPQRLPEPVNSDSSELLPSVDRAGHLYFGSDRPGGHGGTDIYRAVRDAAGEWHVANVASVNTPANDFEADVSRDGSQLAVVSDRDVLANPSLQTQRRRLGARPADPGQRRGVPGRAEVFARWRSPAVRPGCGTRIGRNPSGRSGRGRRSSMASALRTRRSAHPAGHR